MRFWIFGGCQNESTILNGVLREKRRIVEAKKASKGRDFI